MRLSFGKYLFSVTWMPSLAQRPIFVMGVDIAKVTTYVELGKEDTAGGPIYFLGLGRLTFCFRKFEIDYVPAYWQEEEELFAKLLREELDRECPAPPKKGTDSRILPFKKPD